MLLFFTFGAYVYGLVVNKPMFIGDIIRLAVITVWSRAHRLDTMRNLAGLELNYWRATLLPYVYILLLGFLGTYLANVYCSIT